MCNYTRLPCCNGACYGPYAAFRHCFNGMGRIVVIFRQIGYNEGYADGCYYWDWVCNPGNHARFDFLHLRGAMIQDLSFVSIVEFTKEIEQLVYTRDMEYIDAVIYFCEQKGLDIESAASLIRSNSKLKASIQLEAEKLNYLPKTTQLPL